MAPTGHDIIVIGVSAGGVEAVSTLVAQLPATLPAAVFVVVHTDPRTTQSYRDRQEETAAHAGQIRKLLEHLAAPPPMIETAKKPEHQHERGPLH